MTKRYFISGCAATAATLLLLASIPVAGQTQTIPARFSDREFWRLVSDLSPIRRTGEAGIDSGAEVFSFPARPQGPASSRIFTLAFWRSRSRRAGSVVLSLSSTSRTRRYVSRDRCRSPLAR